MRQQIVEYVSDEVKALRKEVIARKFDVSVGESFISINNGDEHFRVIDSNHNVFSYFVSRGDVFDLHRGIYLPSKKGELVNRILPDDLDVDEEGLVSLIPNTFNYYRQDEFWDCAVACNDAYWKSMQISNHPTDAFIISASVDEFGEFDIVSSNDKFYIVRTAGITELNNQCFYEFLKARVTEQY